MIHIRRMTAADIPLGMRLKAQAGWNQREADWHRALRLQPDGCFVAEYDGTAVGTTSTCILGDVAWIAMVLVDSAVRSRGIGKALMEHALAFLDGRGVSTVRLDATPLGRPLYEKLGFDVQYQLSRYAGTLPRTDAAARATSVVEEDYEELFHLDRRVTGTDRRKLLHYFLTNGSEGACLVRDQKHITGYLMTRPGANAAQIGPCIGTAAAAALLLNEAWRRHAGQPVYVDIPEGNPAAASLAQAQGLTAQRQLTRMCRGKPVIEQIPELWAAFGPEKG